MISVRLPCCTSVLKKEDPKVKTFILKKFKLKITLNALDHTDNNLRKLIILIPPEPLYIQKLLNELWISKYRLFGKNVHFIIGSIHFAVGTLDKFIAPTKPSLFSK